MSLITPLVPSTFVLVASIDVDDNGNDSNVGGKNGSNRKDHVKCVCFSKTKNQIRLFFFLILKMNIKVLKMS